MLRRAAIRSAAGAMGACALLTPALACGTAAADPDTRMGERPASSSAAEDRRSSPCPPPGASAPTCPPPSPAARERPAPLPPAAPSAVTSEVLARGAAGEFAVEDVTTGIEMQGDQPTDVVVVRVTLATLSSIPWHRHAGLSMVVVQSGSLRLVEPRHGDGRGCTEETFGPGSAFAHPADVHALGNDGDQPTVFYLTYFVPQGASPAPVPVDPPRGC